MKKEYEYDVSVIVPIYNSMEYLEECIESLLNQTLSRLEIVCVDDGSTDKSFDYLTELQKKNHNIVVISKPNKGYGHSMNVGMAIAKGEYIGILESDDYADTNMFKELYEYAKGHNLDLVKSDFTRFYRNFGVETTEDQLICKKNPDWYGKIWNPSKQPELMDVSMNTWTGIYKSEFLRKNNIRHNETPRASYQDNGFWFQTMSLATRAMFINKVYYHLRRDNPNSSVNNRAKVYCMCDEYDYIYDFLKADPVRYEEFVGMYHKRKYYNYIFTMDRIAYQFKTEFAERMGSEYRHAIEAGELDEGLFSDNELASLRSIMNDPGEFVRNKYEDAEKSSFNSHVVQDLISNKTGKAVEYCSSHLEDPIAHAWLGRIYRDGTDVEKDVDKSINHYREGCKGNVRWAYVELIDSLLKRNGDGDREEAYTIASMVASDSRDMAGVCGRLGRMYRDGVGVTKNIDDAIAWMKKASDNDLSWSHAELVDLLLSRKLGDDEEKAFNIAKNKIHNAKSSLLYIKLGRMYKNGTGTAADLNEAVNCFYKGVETGAFFAIPELYDLIEKRRKTDEKKVFDYAVNVAVDSKERALICGKLGLMYLNGTGTEKDLAEAIRWLSISDKHGVRWAKDDLNKAFTEIKQSRIFNTSLVRNIVKYTPKFALEYCNQFSSDSRSHAWSGRIYRDGIAVKKDINKAIECYREGCKGNVKWAYSELIDLLLKRNGDGDKEEAFTIASQTATDSKEMAGVCGRLGRMYRFGNGVEKDLNLAKKYLAIAINKNYVPAYPVMFDVIWNIGNKDDYPEMIRIAKMGIAVGDGECMGRLGRAYRDGRGVNRDRTLAIKWMNRAAEKNINWAKNELEKMRP